jgi:hypothetical protein
MRTVWIAARDAPQHIDDPDDCVDVECMSGHATFIQPAIAPDVECGTLILYGIFDPRTEEEE